MDKDTEAVLRFINYEIMQITMHLDAIYKKLAEISGGKPAKRAKIVP